MPWHISGRPAPKDGWQCCSVSPRPRFALRRRTPSIAIQQESRRPSFQTRSDAQIVRSTPFVVEFCLSSCCTLLIELFIERTCFVFLSHCSLFKQFLLRFCLFALLLFAYRVVNLLKILLYLSKLSCLVCCVGSLPDLVITQCTFPFNFIFVRNKMMRYDAKSLKYKHLFKSYFISSCFTTNKGTSFTKNKTA